MGNLKQNLNLERTAWGSGDSCKGINFFIQNHIVKRESREPLHCKMMTLDTGIFDFAIPVSVFLVLEADLMYLILKDTLRKYDLQRN